MWARLFFWTLFWQTRIPLCCPDSKIDYLIPFLYLSDIIFGFWFSKTLFSAPARRSLLRFLGQQKKIILLFLFFLLLGFLSFRVSLLPRASFYRWLRIVEIFLALIFLTWQLVEERIKVAFVVRNLVYGLIPLALLGLAEVSLQHSLGFQLIGEWSFDLSTPGIATIVIQGRRWLRPYATFPHPNVFAAALLTAILLIKGKPKLFSPWKEKIIVSLFFLTLLATYSRLLILLTIVLLLIQLTLKYFLSASRSLQLKKEFFLIFFFLAILAFSPLGIYLGQLWKRPGLSWFQRRDLFLYGLDLVQRFPWLGIGLNQFPLWVQKEGFSRYPFLWAQPVHNLFLLIAVEQGLISFFLAVVAFFYFFGRGWWYWGQKKKKAVLYLIPLGLGFLLSSLADHFWWTLPAGNWLLVLIWSFHWKELIIPPPRTSSS